MTNNNRLALDDNEVRLYLSPLKPVSCEKLRTPPAYTIEDAFDDEEKDVVAPSIEQVQENGRRLEDFEAQASAFIDAEPTMLRDNLGGKWIAFVNGTQLAVADTHADAVLEGRKRYLGKGYGGCKRMLYVDQVGRDRTSFLCFDAFHHSDDNN